MMNCPTCDIAMDEHLRHGVRIDHCPVCGGVWLDKGELDHLMAAVRPTVVLPDPEPAPRPAPERRAPKPQSSPPAPRGGTTRGAKQERAAPKPERAAAKPDKTRERPSRARRYAGRFSTKARLKDLIEEIFDFD